MVRVAGLNNQAVVSAAASVTSAVFLPPPTARERAWSSPRSVTRSSPRPVVMLSGLAAPSAPEMTRSFPPPVSMSSRSVSSGSGPRRRGPRSRAPDLVLSGTADEAVLPGPRRDDRVVEALRGVDGVVARAGVGLGRRRRHEADQVVAVSRLDPLPAVGHDHVRAGVPMRSPSASGTTVATCPDRSRPRVPSTGAARSPLPAARRRPQRRRVAAFRPERAAPGSFLASSVSSVRSCWWSRHGRGRCRRGPWPRLRPRPPTRRSSPAEPISRSRPPPPQMRAASPSTTMVLGPSSPPPGRHSRRPRGPRCPWRRRSQQSQGSEVDVEAPAAVLRTQVRHERQIPARPPITRLPAWKNSLHATSTTSSPGPMSACTTARRRSPPASRRRPNP